MSFLNRSALSEGDNRNQMSPEPILVKTRAGFPANFLHPSAQFPPKIPYNTPIYFPRSLDYRDTTNQKPQYDSEQSQTISLKSGFRFNNPYNGNDSFGTNINANKNVTYNTNDPRLQTNNHDVAQRQKVFDFIVSDTHPKSFQPPTILSPNDIKLVNNAFVNSKLQSSSIIISSPSAIINKTSLETPNSTTHPIAGIAISPAQLPPVNENNKRSVLKHGLRAQDTTKNSIHDSSESISTAITLATRPRDEIVVPTTYAPLKNWKLQYLNKPSAMVTTLPVNTIDGSQSNDKKHLFQIDEITFTTPLTPVILKSTIPYQDVKDYNRPLSQSTRLRHPSFREFLNKTYETSTPSKFHVSPFTSLKSLLSEELAKVPFRPYTLGPNSTSLPASNPFRSYYIITAPPRKNIPDPTHSTTSISTNNNQQTSTPISISSLAPVLSSTSDWTPISYNYKEKSPSSESGRLIPFKPTENSIDAIDIDMTTSNPTRVNLSSTYYHRENLTKANPTTTAESIRSTKNTFSAPSERDHYRKVVRMRSKKKVQPSNGQTFIDETDIIHGIQKLSDSPLSTHLDENIYKPIVESSTKHIELPSHDVPTKFYSNYRHVKEEKTLGDLIRDHDSKTYAVSENYERTPEPTSTMQAQSGQRQKFRATIEMPEFNIPTESEIRAKLKQLEANAEKDIENEDESTTEFSRAFISSNENNTTAPVKHRTIDNNNNYYSSRRMTITATGLELATKTTTEMNSNMTIMTTTQRTANSIHTLPPRASRVNAAIKSTIAAASLPPTRRSNMVTTTPIRFATLPLLECTDSTPNAKCNEIPSRYTNQAN